jgi:hypothetical protein
MSDIRKLLDIITETSAGATSSGSVASVATPMSTTQRRSRDSIFYEGEVCKSCGCESCLCSDGNTVDGNKAPDAPRASVFGNWQNSRLAGVDKKTKHTKKKQVSEGDFGVGQRALKLAERGHNKEHDNKKLEKDLDRLAKKEIEGGTGEHHKIDEFMNSAPEDHNQTALKRVPFKKGLVQEFDLHEPTHEDDDMAKNQIHTIRRAADELEQIIQNDRELPQWIHSKITIAKDYLDTVHEYLLSDKERQAEQATGREGIEFELDEVLTPDMSAGDVIHDFVHSKNKTFKGDNKKERIKRALGAYYGMKRGR